MKWFFKNILMSVLPVLCSAKIKIYINIASNLDDSSVTFSGQDNKIVTEKEINTFNLTMDNLNRGMRIELGKVPQDIFLKDPTPYENLYEYFEWPQVQRNLRIKNAKVVEIINEKVIIATHEHVNNAKDPVEAKIRLMQNIENTIFSTWSDHGLPADDIFYDINVNLNKLKYKFENKWRNDEVKSFILPFGVSKDGFLRIKPGQVVTSELTAVKMIFLVEIEYEAKIIGSFIADYDPLYGKYHFYAPTTAAIMKAASLKNEVRTTELIELRCYIDPKLRVFDKTGDEVEIVTPTRLFRNKKKVLKVKH